MKLRIIIATLFLLGLGTSSYYNHKASAATSVLAVQHQATTQCCSGDPDGTLWPPHVN